MYAKTSNKQEDDQAIGSEQLLCEYTRSHNIEYARLNGNYVPTRGE